MSDIETRITRGGSLYTTVNPAFEHVIDRITALRVLVPEDQRDRLPALEVTFEAAKRFYEIAEMAAKLRTNAEKLAGRVEQGQVSVEDAAGQAQDLNQGFVRAVHTIVTLTPPEDKSLIKHK
jgi:hypothetical protein